MGERLRVGIVGLEPGRSWGAMAHLPALRALSSTFEVVGVANSNLDSTAAAAAACGIPHAFASVRDLVSSQQVDIVAVTVKVPRHREVTTAAIAAGKHVYCEWPLGNGLAEAEALTALAHARGVHGVVGTQARVAPEVLYVRDLVADGFVGEVLSSTISGFAGVWGEAFRNERASAYSLDRKNGTTMLTVTIGHTLAAVRGVLGDIDEVSAILATRRRQARALDTGAVIPMTAPDQVLVGGIMASGAPISVHFRGGPPRSETGFMWEINGTAGDIRLTGANANLQAVQLSVLGGRGDERTMRALETPYDYRAGAPRDATTGNVARMYARMALDLSRGTHTAPNFADGLALHRVIAAIEHAAETGRSVTPESLGFHAYMRRADQRR
ncbi:MAG TPA: Gfo/Idh/MocA family oxidoreductase [Caulobacteraceae bacterium]|nr:Gfo/Idh/MocA family oxidoreductase [Caulobacteraceae bacterium]